MTNFYFAPLEGVTGYTYRNVYEELFGDVDKYYAPFVSPSTNTLLKGKEIRDLLPENNFKDIVLIPQILANRADYFIKAAEQLEELGYKDEFNINIGCPSGTVVSKHKGAGFLTELDDMDRFFEQVFKWNDNPNRGYKISVKTRIGMYEAKEFENILQVYNRYPISMLIVHPRTREMMYKGKPDLDAFKYALNHSTNPLCYNGDINNVEDYNLILEELKKDAPEIKLNNFMLGRGLIGNPNLINEIKGGESLTIEQLKKYHDKLYIEFEKIMKSDLHLLYKMKEYWNYMSWNFTDQHKCLKLIRKSQNIYKYHKAVETIFSSGF